MPHEFLIIERQKEMPKIHGRGRKKGSGPNMKMLAGLAIGDSVWDVPKGKMLSICSSAKRSGVKIQVRKIPGTDLYAIKRIQCSSD